MLAPNSRFRAARDRRCAILRERYDFSASDELSYPALINAQSVKCDI